MKKPEMLPKPKPKEEIEVSSSHTKLKIFIVIVAIIVALVSFGIGISRCMSTDKGWKKLNASGGESCAGDFVCYYYLDVNGRSGTDRLNAVNAAYSEACINAYRIFNAEKEFEGLTNLATLNKNANTEVIVDESLYKAFGILESSGRRDLYRAPVYTNYYNLCFSETDASASELDPKKNADAAANIAKILSFANSSDHVSLTLMGENKVKLNVSAEYKAFFEEEEYSSYLDFYVLKNAFIADYIAEFMQGKGFGGLLSSNDGYMRSFLGENETYTLNVFDVEDNYLNNAATISGTGKVSAVRFRDYGLGSDTRFDNFYTYSDGTTVTPYLTDEGLCRSSINNLLVYSYSESCARLMLKALPVYTAEEFSSSAISELKASSIYSVYCKDKAVIFNDSSLGERLKLVESKDYSYTKRYEE